MQTTITPDEIVGFWFPDGPAPEPQRHLDLWMWRMRGGANDEIIAKYTDTTQRAAMGEFDHWAQTATGRLALIIVLDQFSRTIWAGLPRAYAQDPKALSLCLEGLENGHFEALENVWFKTAFRIPLEHCECADHMSNLDRAVEIAVELQASAPENLRAFYQIGIDQPKKHRAVIARFGRHAHRNSVLGRTSTPDEQEYIASGAFPHEIDIVAESDKIAGAGLAE